MQTLNWDAVTPSVKEAVLLAPCYHLWCLKSVTYGGQGQNWLGKTACLEKNPFVVYLGTLQADRFTHLVPWKGSEMFVLAHRQQRRWGKDRIVAPHTHNQSNILGLESK